MKHASFATEIAVRNMFFTLHKLEQAIKHFIDEPNLIDPYFQPSLKLMPASRSQQLLKFNNPIFNLVIETFLSISAHQWQCSDASNASGGTRV